MVELARQPVVRGAYDATQTYNPLDIVYVGKAGNSDSYVCVRGNVDHPVTDTEYWALMVKGRDGVAGAVPTIKVSSNGTWVVNGNDTGVKLPQAADVFKVNEMPDDLNSARGFGYYLGDITSASHRPDGAAGWALLEVINGATDGVQRLTLTNSNAIYQRTWHDTTTWTDWVQTTQFN